LPATDLTWGLHPKGGDGEGGRMLAAVLGTPRGTSARRKARLESLANLLPPSAPLPRGGGRGHMKAEGGGADHEYAVTALQR